MPFGDDNDYRAEDYARLAKLALAQARATLHQPTAIVLTRLASDYLEKAKALGWKPPPQRNGTK